jgi:hypothetical protein
MPYFYLITCLLLAPSRLGSPALLHAYGTEGLWSADWRRQELFGVWHGDCREVLGRFPLPRKVTYGL